MIDILIPVLNRPRNAQLVVRSIAAHTTVDFSVIFICSLSDHAQIRACKRTGARVLIDNYGQRSQYPQKMNAGFRATDRPYLLLAADDLEFTPGWDAEVLRVAEKSGAGVIGTNDMGHPDVLKGRFSTHPMVRRTYIEEYGGSLDGPGTIFSLAYDHNYSDRELCHLAQFRGKWAFAGGCRIIHNHPSWGKAPVDATYRKGALTISEDYQTFKARAAGWGQIGVRRRVPVQRHRR